MSGLTFGILRSKIWHSRDFRSLDADSKLLFIYFLTNSARNVVGAYHLPLGHIEADTCYPRDEILRRVELMPGVTYAEAVQWVVVENYMRNNPLVNQNYVTSAHKILRSLPEDLVLLEGVLRATEGVRTLDRRTVRELEDRIRRLETGKALLPSKSLISLDDKGLVSHTKPLDLQVKGLVSHPKGLAQAGNVNKISLIRQAMGLSVFSGGEGACIPSQGASPGDSRDTDDKSKGLSVRNDDKSKPLVPTREGACKGLVKTPVSGSGDDAAEESEVLVIESENRAGKGLGEGASPRHRKTAISAAISAESASLTSRTPASPFTLGARGLPGAYPSEAEISVSNGADFHRPNAFKSMSRLHLKPVIDSSEGASPSSGSSAGKIIAEIVQAVDMKARSADLERSKVIPVTENEGVKPLVKGLTGGISEKNQAHVQNGAGSSEGHSPLRDRGRYINTRTTLVGEGVQGGNLDEPPSNDRPPETLPNPAPCDDPPTPPQVPVPAGLPEGPVQPALFEDLAGPAATVRPRGNSGKKQSPAGGVTVIDGDASPAASSKTIRVKTFPEDLFVPKLCALWNLICVPHGARQMGVVSAVFEGKVRSRYQEAQKTPGQIKRPITTLEDWAQFFHYLVHSDFLMGKATPRDGSRPFRVELPWIMRNTETFWKARSGGYHSQSTERQIPEFVMPNLKNYDLDQHRV